MPFKTPKTVDFSHDSTPGILLTSIPFAIRIAISNSGSFLKAKAIFFKNGNSFLKVTSTLILPFNFIPSTRIVTGIPGVTVAATSTVASLKNSIEKSRMYSSGAALLIELRSDSFGVIVPNESLGTAILLTAGGGFSFRSLAIASFIFSFVMFSVNSTICGNTRSTRLFSHSTLSLSVFFTFMRASRSNRNQRLSHDFLCHNFSTCTAATITNTIHRKWKPKAPST
mmetsp:Transcript_29394/g.32674  ORF Transcript_29394/g.32674 Transcript_29394/m.32674 type:complete len:226 (-) Transcript_29394:92-769(-)